MKSPTIREPLVVTTPHDRSRSDTPLNEMLIDFTKVRKTAAILFLGLSGFYLSLSPTSIAGQGYTGEEIDSGLRMLAVII